MARPSFPETAPDRRSKCVPVMIAKIAVISRAADHRSFRKPS